MSTLYVRMVEPARRLFEHFALGSAPSFQRVNGRFQMQIDPTDMADRLYFRGAYSREFVRLVRGCVRPGDLCVDVGAQKGYFTLEMAACTGPTGRVIAFEPDPRARRLLNENLERSRMPWVTVRPEALGRSEGSAEFNLSSQLGWSSLHPNDVQAVTVNDRIQVRVRPFDAIADELALDASRLRLVKIDCEGAEAEVVDGMRSVLAHARPIVWMELNRASLAVAATTPEALIEETRSLGYRPFLAHLQRVGPFRAGIELTPMQRVPPDERVVDVALIDLGALRAAGGFLHGVTLIDSPTGNSRGS